MQTLPHDYAGEVYKIILTNPQGKKIEIGRNILKDSRTISSNWEKMGPNYQAIIINTKNPKQAIQTRSTFWNQK